MVAKKTLNEFINEANKIHNNKYDYSLTKYINAKTKVKIICSKHGVFEQNANDHLRGHGCSYCAKNKKKNVYEFIKQANIIHNNKYDYSLVEYINSTIKVKIICSKHGVFKQRPNEHLKGKGCFKCNKNYPLSKIEFIKKASKKHNNKYDYKLIDFKNVRSSIKIICPKHGVFKQKASNHLYGDGCPKCSNRISLKQIEWLNSLNIKEREVCLNINGKKYFVDGFDSETNTIYEFNGDFWHGNPKIYDQNKIAFSKNTFGMLYENTIKKKKALEKAGYKVISIWESEFDSKANIKE